VYVPGGLGALAATQAAASAPKNASYLRRAAMTRVAIELGILSEPPGRRW